MWIVRMVFDFISSSADAGAHETSLPLHTNFGIEAHGRNAESSAHAGATSTRGC